jgi:mono/diheme cytochrome c family protein
MSLLCRMKNSPRRMDFQVRPRWTTLSGRLGRARKPILLCCALALLAGCGGPEPAFQPNVVFRVRQEKTAGENFPASQLADKQNALVAFFGTPDEPHAPLLTDLEVSTVIDESKLYLAAGPVASDRTGKSLGLYREHCVHCHGITGDGRGPTAAALNPYPRDFRAGIFKFKSTPKGSKPTHEDLKKIVLDGIPGTAMPSFRLLDEGEIDALVNYVKYLSIRGEVERRMLIGLLELEKEDRLVDTGLKTSKPDEFSGQLETLKGTVATVVGKWQSAAAEVTPIPTRAEGWDEPETLAASVKRGRDLFYGSLANCFSCHGDSALGDGQTNDFDDWTKELEPKVASDVREYVRLGALPPRNMKPRNLRLGVFRGGRRPIDLYWRISQGIEGVPMPNAPMRVEGDPPDAKKLTPEDIWSLVDYVRSLPNESISRPPPAAAENLREKS